jgi:glycine cleavage system H protein
MGKSGDARIGLDDLLLHITGEVSVKHLKNRDDIIRKGDIIAEVTRQGRSLNIVSPVSGKILEENPALHMNQDLLTKDPYGEGWLYNLKPSNWVEEIPSCFLSEEATNWLKNELDRYKDFVAINIGKYSEVSSFTVLQDGGEIADNSLSELPEGMWNDFQKEFLDLKETI